MDSYFLRDHFVLEYVLYLMLPFLSNVYLNDLSNNISSTVTVFADDRFLLSVFDNINVSMVQLSNNLEKIAM